ncbi:hypothetical protein [Staphylococcus hominis]|uniref:Uncharacterized protein n=1 Tax=Staphylococcus hominis TaxID=1290 RepID=A0A3S7GWT1_STAHO|nr:hypothetical protein [Staphylococcus hominis]AVI05752.1 hypothetical protein AZE34_02875 [Staphylococcus hominis]MDU3976995.1 hypothetical protein [Staphylococcus sp.]MDU3987919.1 hypothetical protein [Staphylococcus sp.]
MKLSRLIIYIRLTLILVFTAYLVFTVGFFVGFNFALLVYLSSFAHILFRLEDMEEKMNG